MTYGNVDLSSTSDGDATFVFFDDFEDAFCLPRTGVWAATAA
jgi:hypothetical protein